MKFSSHSTYILKERRRKLLFSMHLLCIAIFIVMIAKNIYINHLYNSIIASMGLFFTIVSFLFLYYRKKYEQASYFILLILCGATLFAIYYSKFDDFTPVFIIPVSLGVFFLFSWKRGIYINLLFIFSVFLLYFYNKDYFYESLFLQNNTTLFNFVVILLIIFTFTYFYESVRVESYQMLLKSNQEKDLLYNEVHHRVKNNLNLISSMLSMQAKKRSDETKEVIDVSKRRIDSIAIIHSMLYISNNLERVNAKKFIEKLTQHISLSMPLKVTVLHRIKDIELSLNKIIPLGLILNELLTNSFKHAFKYESNPKIVIDLKNDNEDIILNYHDNGSIAKSGTKGVGLALVNLNVKQLKGKMIVTQAEKFKYKIIFKRSLYV